MVAQRFSQVPRSDASYLRPAGLPDALECILGLSIIADLPEAGFEIRRMPSLRATRRCGASLTAEACENFVVRLHPELNAG